MTKNFILAGASGNLGQGVLKIFLTKDYDNFIIFIRNSQRLNISDKRIKIIETGDLSIEENVRSAFSKIIPDKNSVFYLLSTIGGFMGGQPLWEYSEEELERMLRLNLFTAFLISKYFSLLVKESAAGTICLTSAMTSLRPELNKSIYSLSKSALNSMIKTLALEGRSINLSANAIAPYIIDTPENREWVKDLSVLITPEEIAELVHSMFQNYRFVSGNVMELKQKLNIKTNN